MGDDWQERDALFGRMVTEIGDEITKQAIGRLVEKAGLALIRFERMPRPSSAVRVIGV